MNRVIEGEIVAVSPAKPRRSFPVVSVMLLVVVAGLGVLFLRERSEHAEDVRRLKAQNARSVQRTVAVGAELAVVRAQRDEARARLVRGDGLGPEAIAAIRACVQRYAEYERTPGGGPALAQTACMKAEPYIR